MVRLACLLALCTGTIALPCVARAQVHQMICNSTDAPGVSITVLPGAPGRVLVGGCGKYIVLHVTRGPSGLVAVGDATFTWAAAVTDATHTMATMRPVLGDLVGDAAIDVALGFAQFSTRGGGRGGGVYVLPMREDGGFARAMHPFRGTPASLTCFDGDGDGRDELVVVENGEPWAGRPGAVSTYARGRRRTRLASVIMSPIGAAIFGSGASAEVVVAGEIGAGDDSVPGLARGLLSGGAVTTLPLPHDTWASAFVDVDRDGQLDVAMAGVDGVYVSTPALDHLLRADTFAPERLGPIDLDGHGLHALAYCANDHLRVASCEAARCTSVPWLGASCESYADVVIADLDGDGQREMLMANREHYQDDESRSAVWLTFIPGPAMHTGVRVVELPFAPGPTTALR
jgi:hypothetical protein